jgi:hypothetical protein
MYAAGQEHAMKDRGVVDGIDWHALQEIDERNPKHTVTQAKKKR